ncbi:fumarylacetoacetate hydrolase family protein [Sulfurimonas sp.]|uniref:fumarylacetoacetate hydrolase family protein n=1 Tax=Sulfurimonas sp. TaxID=2022749 RepID=UPI002B475056|nr:fumarylacetoacetate hydrolase family protein [Sulfurimonas sp.]
MTKKDINKYGEELYNSLKNCEPIEALTAREPNITIADAYAIQDVLIKNRIKKDGSHIIGKKIGVTAKVVMNLLGVNQPDFGYLLSDMIYNDGDVIDITSNMIQPKAEGEIAFVLKEDLQGPGVTASDVIKATKFVMPCFEIVDSRVKDWKIKIQDTVADNASCGYIVFGGKAVDIKDVDLITCGMTLERNGELLQTGAGAATLGSPVNAVVWLANTLGKLGVGLKAGEVILSGALSGMVPIKSGDSMSINIGGIGSASVRFE